MVWRSCILLTRSLTSTSYYDASRRRRHRLCRQLQPGLIVGLAAGGGGLLMIVLLGVLLFMRRKKKVAESAVPKKLGIAARLGWGR